MSEDQNRAPILEAIQAYRETGTLAFTTPGHKGGSGIDAYTAEVIGRSAFENDVPESAVRLDPQIGRVDLELDRKQRVLRVHSLHLVSGAPIKVALDELAGWLGARAVVPA